MTAFSRPNSCELKNLSNCNEFELISLSKYLKHQYQLAENEPDYTSMLNIVKGKCAKSLNNILTI